MTAGAYKADGGVEERVREQLHAQYQTGEELTEGEAAAAEELGDDYRPVDVYAGTEALVRSWGVEADRRHGHMRLLLPFVDADGKLRTHEVLLDTQDAQELVDALQVGMDHLETGARPGWRTA